MSLTVQAYAGCLVASDDKSYFDASWFRINPGALIPHCSGAAVLLESRSSHIANLTCKIALYVGSRLIEYSSKLFLPTSDSQYSVQKSGGMFSRA